MFTQPPMSPLRASISKFYAEFTGNNGSQFVATKSSAALVYALRFTTIHSDARAYPEIEIPPNEISRN